MYFDPPSSERILGQENPQTHCSTEKRRILTSEKQKRPTARPWDPTAFYNLFEFELKVVFICYGPISTQL